MGELVSFYQEPQVIPLQWEVKQHVATPAAQPVEVVSFFKERSRMREPFAFDLRYEEREIRKHGEAYLPIFIAQAHYYAKENFAMPSVEYQHDIESDESGKPILVFGLDKTRARDSYEIPINDRSLPDWYRFRAVRDREWVRGIEKGLAEITDKETGEIEEGAMFIDFSPTAFNVPFEERKKWNFGLHSFARLHTVATINGKQKLISHTIRNYLDLPEQLKLFELFTKEQVAGDRLLGTVRKLETPTTVGRVQKIAKDLYDMTPAERKLVPPDSDTIYANNEEMDKRLAKEDGELREAFYSILRGDSRSTSQEIFRGWENKLADPDKKAYREWQEAQLKTVQNHDPSQGKPPLALIAGHQTETQFYRNKKYKSQASQCGSGSGYGDDDEKDGKKRESGQMNYQGITQKEKEKAKEESTSGEDCPRIACGRIKPECGWVANEEEAKLIAERKLTSCPGKILGENGKEVTCGWAPQPQLAA